jgi:hypothetical protein
MISRLTASGHGITAGRFPSIWKIRERRLPPEEIVPCRPERQNIMKEYRLQTGAPENRAAKSTFPWKDKIGSSARISGISGNVWPGLILYIAILFINIVAKENFKYEKTYKSSAYRGFLSLNRCHIPDDTSFTGFFP